MHGKASILQRVSIALHSCDRFRPSACASVLHSPVSCQNKTAELSQRRPRDAPNIWVPWKVLRVLTSHPATFSEICRRLLFRSILRMCVQKLKFVALPVP